jgi:hypothetical protein
VRTSTGLTFRICAPHNARPRANLAPQQMVAILGAFLMCKAAEADRGLFPTRSTSIQTIWFETFRWVQLPHSGERYYAKNQKPRLGPNANATWL